MTVSQATRAPLGVPWILLALFLLVYITVLNAATPLPKTAPAPLSPNEAPALLNAMEALEHRSQIEALRTVDPVEKTKRPHPVKKTEGPDPVHPTKGPHTVGPTEGPDPVLPTDGPDPVHTTKGPDPVEKTEGPDAFEKTEGPDPVHTTKEPDPVDKREGPDPVEKTEGPDRVHTTKGPDPVEKTEGPDRVHTTKGPDPVEKTEGPDAFEKTEGLDPVHTTKEPDPVDKTEGPDPVKKAEGPDRVHTTKGPDPVEKTEGPDPVHTTEGPDPVEKTEGPDRVHTTKGPDPVEKTEGPDPVHTTEGPHPVEKTEGPDPVDPTEGPDSVEKTEDPEMKGGYQTSSPGPYAAKRCRKKFSVMSESQNFIYPAYNIDGTRPHYKPNLGCEWKFTAVTADTRIRFEFHEMEIELSDDCRFDSLQFENVKYCGTRLPGAKDSPGVLVLPSPVSVRFTTDSQEESTGVIFDFYINPANNSAVAACGGTRRATSGLLMSPGFPNTNYPVNSACNWTLPAGHVVQLHVEDFRLQASTSKGCSDAVSIMAAGQSTQYCGSDLKEGQELELNGTIPVVLTFTSDSDGEERGFRIFYRVLTRDEFNKENQDFECGATLEVKEGTKKIASPGYWDDVKYPPNARCRWELLAPAGHVISLTRRAFSLHWTPACRSDRLVVWDSGRRIGTFCGASFPEELLSKTSNLSIEFWSDKSKQSYGFFFEYSLKTKPSPPKSPPGHGNPTKHGKYEDKFQCKNGVEVEGTEVCNQVDDCGDASDEDPVVAGCDGVFTCKSGKKIKTSQTCNGVPDCPDGDDERKAANCNGKSENGFFVCKKSRRAIPYSFFCDGVVNCKHDGSDESVTEGCNKTKPCDSMPCNNGGTCTVSTTDQGSVVCLCPTQWTGPTCLQDNDNSCSQKPCWNGGTCHDQVVGYICECRLTFMGVNCTEVVPTARAVDLYLEQATGIDNTSCGSITTPCKSIEYIIARSRRANIYVTADTPLIIGNVFLNKDIKIIGKNSTGHHQPKLVFNDTIAVGDWPVVTILQVENIEISGTLFAGNVAFRARNVILRHFTLHQENQRRRVVHVLEYTINKSVIESSVLATVISKIDSRSNDEYQHNCYLAKVAIAACQVNNSLIEIAAVDIQANIHKSFFAAQISGRRRDLKTLGLYFRFGFRLDASDTTRYMDSSATNKGRRKKRDLQSNTDSQKAGNECALRKNLQQASDPLRRADDRYCDEIPEQTKMHHQGHRVRRAVVDPARVSASSTTSTTSSVESISWIVINQVLFDSLYQQDTPGQAALTLTAHTSFTAEITKSIFIRNKRGIQVDILSKDIIASLSIHKVTINESTSRGPGGGVNIDQKAGEFAARFQKVHFYNNYATPLVAEPKDTNRTTKSYSVSKITGSGGAISINADAVGASCIVEIKNCIFNNNTALNYGGSLYFTPGVTARISDSSFYNLNISKKGIRPRIGDILESRGNLYMVNNMFMVLTADDDVSILSYRASDDGAFLETDTLNLTCPTGYTATRIINAQQGHGRQSPVETLLLYCRACKQGSYTIINSNMIISGIKVLEQTNITCEACPYGALCDALVRSKANFWGKDHGNKVIMYLCPEGYCCQEALCNRFSYCAPNRQGILCSECAPGYTESLFSTECILNSKCTYASVFWAVIAAYGIAYVMFFIFEDEVQILIDSFANWFRRTIRQCKSWNSPRQRKEPSVMGEEEEEDVPDAPGAFLQIVMYYVQVSSLLKIDIIYEDERDIPIKKYGETLKNIFSFNTFGLNLNTCLFADVTAISKPLLKSAFILYLFFAWAVIFMFGKCINAVLKMGNRNKRRRRSQQGVKWITPASINAKFIGALVQLLLFTYQYFAENSLIMLKCIDIDTSVLFIYARVQCYEPWQYGFIAFATIYVFPFFFALGLAPNLLKKRIISVRIFILSTLLPLFFTPMLLYKWLRYWKQDFRHNELRRNKHGTVEVVADIVAEPYRDDIAGGLCWEGMIALRRLVLTVIVTLMNNVLYRHIFLMLGCYLSFALHLMFEPFSLRMSNALESLSLGILLSISIMNLLKSSYFDLGEVPKENANYAFWIYDWVEAVLLGLIPLILLGIVLLLVVIRVLVFIMTGCRCESSSSKRTNPAHHKARHGIYNYRSRYSPDNSRAYDFDDSQPGRREYHRWDEASYGRIDSFNSLPQGSAIYQDYWARGSPRLKRSQNQNEICGRYIPRVREHSHPLRYNSTSYRNRYEHPFD